MYFCCLELLIVLVVETVGFWLRILLCDCV